MSARRRAAAARSGTRARRRLRLVALLVVPLALAGAAPRAQDPAREDSARPGDEAALLADLLPGAPAPRRAAALAAIAASGDRRWLAPLTDLLAFAPTAEEWYAILDAAAALGEGGGEGEDLRALPRPWRELTTRLARDLPAPLAGYGAFKGELLAQQVDPGYRELLPPGVATRVRLEEVVWGGVPIDGIPALVRPKVVLAKQAGFLEDAEPVFGVSVNGAHRAYPLRILDWHELANDVVGGEPVALTWCTLCGAGVLYSARAGERTFELGSSGLLMRSNKLMFDRGTRSLWNQLTGEPVVGPLAALSDGERPRLRVLPSVVTSWSAWRSLHPDTDVVTPDTGYERDYTPGAAYGEYFGSAETMFPVARRPGAGPAKERLFALRVGTRARAWPLAEVERAGGVVNDALDGLAVVLVGPLPRRAGLPAAWREACERAGLAPPPRLDALAPADAVQLLRATPELARGLDAETLLALSDAARLAVLDAFAGPSIEDVESAEDAEVPGTAPVRIARRLRDEAAQRGLAGEVRAYGRGSHAFAPGPEGSAGQPPDILLDERGASWRVTEDALVGPEGARLERLPGHLVFRFGWEAFHPPADPRRR